MLEVIGILAIGSLAVVVCFAGGALWFSGSMLGDNKTSRAGFVILAIGMALFWFCCHLSPFSISVVRT